MTLYTYLFMEHMAIRGRWSVVGGGLILERKDDGQGEELAMFTRPVYMNMWGGNNWTEPVRMRGNSIPCSPLSMNPRLPVE